jgi:hypothetical protein
VGSILLRDDAVERRETSLITAEKLTNERFGSIDRLPDDSLP